jgi:hypothetical protein
VIGWRSMRWTGLSSAMGCRMGCHLLRAHAERTSPEPSTRNRPPLAGRVSPAPHRLAGRRPLALVRVGPQQLVGGRPAGMLGRGVPLQVPGADEPLAAAVDRAAPVKPRVARIVEAERGVRLGLADLEARDADQHREQALDLAERPREVPAERTVRPHPAPARSERVFANESRRRGPVGTGSVAACPCDEGSAQSNGSLASLFSGAPSAVSSTRT